jgi:hypothetical protein
MNFVSAVLNSSNDIIHKVEGVYNQRRPV